MTQHSFKQMKLTSGDEIVADVVERDDDSVIIRAAMRIVEVEHLEEGYSYFAFRPFVAFNDSIENLSVLTAVHIINETIPSDNLLTHYASSVRKMNKFLRGGKTLEEFECMDDEEVEEYIQKFVEEELKDSKKQEKELGPIVVVFKPKDTIH